MFGTGVTRTDIAEIWDVVEAQRMDKVTAALKAGYPETADKLLLASDQAALSAKTAREVSKGLMSSGARWPK